MSEQQRKTHLDREELERANNIVHYLEVRIDRADELAKDISETLKENEFLRKDIGVQQDIKQIRDRRSP